MLSLIGGPVLSRRGRQSKRTSPAATRVMLSSTAVGATRCSRRSAPPFAGDCRRATRAGFRSSSRSALACPFPQGSPLPSVLLKRGCPASVTAAGLTSFANIALPRRSRRIAYLRLNLGTGRPVQEPPIRWPETTLCQGSRDAAANSSASHRRSRSVCASCAPNAVGPSAWPRSEWVSARLSSGAWKMGKPILPSPCF